jgi:undecaprenyl diphosphate synthase
MGRRAAESDYRIGPAGFHGADRPFTGDFRPFADLATRAGALRAQGEAWRYTMVPFPGHVAIVMDGNGRWATERGLSREEGHRRGAEAVRRVVRAARELGVPALTLYAFSAQNWGRPELEVSHLMRLLRTFALRERAELLARDIRVVTIGERRRLPPSVRAPLAALEASSAGNRGMTLCLALSYGAREALTAAARALAADAAQGRLRPDDVTEQLLSNRLDTNLLPPLDLLIRTSGEQRLSNFLLWEAAYAELHFTPVLWPDFDREALVAALADYAGRQRRFGLAAEPRASARAGC